SGEKMALQRQILIARDAADQAKNDVRDLVKAMESGGQLSTGQRDTLRRLNEWFQGTGEGLRLAHIKSIERKLFLIWGSFTDNYYFNGGRGKDPMYFYCRRGVPDYVGQWNRVWNYMKIPGSLSDGSAYWGQNYNQQISTILHELSH